MKGEELGRERGSRGGVLARKKTPQSEAMIWLLVLSSGEGKEERNDMERAREKMGGKGRGSPRPSGGLSSLWFVLPLFYIFYTKCPHTKP